jgi:hypothetical protein
LSKSFATAQWLGVQDLDKLSLTAFARHAVSGSGAAQHGSLVIAKGARTISCLAAESAFMPGELPFSDQAVAHAADCLDAVAADLGPQVADIHPDHVRTWVEIEPPNAAE